MSASESTPDLRLNTPVGELPGSTDVITAALARLRVRSISDLLRHLPARYEYQPKETSIGELTADRFGVTRGQIMSTAVGQPGRGRARRRFVATIQGDASRLRLVWFNAHYLKRKLHAGMVIRVRGKATMYEGQLQMVNPQWEPLEEPEETPASEEFYRPIYPATEDLPSYQIESIVERVLDGALEKVVDPLPAEYLDERAMPGLALAYRMAHRPRDEREPKSARRRLIYNELLVLQLALAIKRRHHQKQRAVALPCSQRVDEHIRSRFPFGLTDAQNRVVQEIASDLALTRPMNRLLQGDVGSGKTVVALYAMLLATVNRCQAALMAPTELLAEQHYESFLAMLKGSSVRISLLTGGSSSAGSAQRAATLREVARGKVDIVVGTSAILGAGVKFNRLAVVVVDEQHRFGVEQRAALKAPVPGADTGDRAACGSPDASAPHFLVMTATPIPRSLSLTLFGDLDVSVIDELPPGRGKVATRVVAPGQADRVYRYLAERVGRGEQAYVVVPTIDASDHESTKDLKQLDKHAGMLAEHYLAGRKVATVHGRLKRRERESIMNSYRAGEIDVLVATTVIEVGVDVPNATVMVVEHAERFGLAQLHQLRGRVGRGTNRGRSLCAFIADPTSPEAEQRMQAIASTTNGFAIAEKDLEIRGMGDLFGTRQHGLPPLRVARLPDDIDLLTMARRDAQALIEKDPQLKAEGWSLLQKVLLQQHGEELPLADVG